MGFLKLTAEGRCEGLRPAEIWKMQRGRKWIPEKTLCDGGCVCVCERVCDQQSTWWRVCNDWSLCFFFFLILGRYDVGVWLCLFHSSIRLCLYISLCLRSPSFTSSPLPPLSIPYSIDFALWQTAVAFDPNPVICLYCVLNMVADEISMHYCHPVADSSTSVCAVMHLLPAESVVESLMLVDYFIFITGFRVCLLVGILLSCT